MAIAAYGTLSNVRTPPFSFSSKYMQLVPSAQLQPEGRSDVISDRFGSELDGTKTRYEAPREGKGR